MTYYHKVNSKKFCFPDFKEHCPICWATNCAKFLGYYYRGAVDKNGTYFKELPIARYECSGKGSPKIGHKTFSLLPYQLIPYNKYSIEFMIRTMSYWKAGEHNVEETLDFIFKLLDKDENPLKIKLVSNFQLYKFGRILEMAIEKIIVCNIEGIMFAKIIDKKGRILEFIRYCENYCSYRFNEEIRGPPALNIDFYVTGGSYIKNAQFLFGTPSQFR